MIKLFAATFAFICFMNVGQVLAANVRPVPFHGMSGYCISDGKTQAIVVPQIGRIMWFGKLGGDSLLWTAPKFDWKPRDWKNYGGEKVWLSPQSSWAEFYGSDNWPPDPILDGGPYDAKIVAPGVLEMRSRLSQGTGIVVDETISYDDSGELAIKLTATKQSGQPVRAGIWSIAQVSTGNFVYLPVSERSSYKKGYVRLEGKPSIMRAWAEMVEVDPSANHDCKIGVDSDVQSIVSVRGRCAFLISSKKQPGTYPDGADTDGLPVELYVNNTPSYPYSELELLGPLMHAKPGTSWSMTIFWSLHDLPPEDANGDVGAVRKLLHSQITDPDIRASR